MQDKESLRMALWLGLNNQVFFSSQDRTASLLGNVQREKIPVRLQRDSLADLDSNFLSLFISLGALVLWSTCLPIADQAHAASPITPSGLNTQVNLAPALPPGKVQYDITGG